MKERCRNRKTKFGRFLDIYTGKINRFNKISVKYVDLFKPDMVVFDNSRTVAGNMFNIKKLGPKVVTIHHNYEMEYYNKGTKQPFLWISVFKYYMKKAEKTAVLQSDLNLTLTKQDAYLLQKNYDLANSSLFRNIGVFESKEKVHFYNDFFEKKKGIDKLCFAITGSLGSHQSEISIIEFLKFYYPIVLNKYPDSTLIIAGKDPTENLRRLCSGFSNITLIENPINMTSTLVDSDIYLCPVNVGGGLKLRIMDGLSVGIPVITNKVSARGFDEFMDSGFMFEYNDIKSFEICLNRISASFFEREKILNLYEKIFTFENGCERLRVILFETFNLFNL